MNKKVKIASLQLSKSLLNVKQLGEELENWCNNEYQHYAISGFDTCTWEKDNKSIKDPLDAKGTKADYIFKVYATNEKNEEESINFCRM
jgi:hypothetical protein